MSQRAPSGYRFDAQGGLAPIPGGPAEVATGPAATVQSMVPGALSDLGHIQSRLVDPQTGEVNAMLLGTMNVPGFGAAVPGTPGAELRSAFEGAMDTMVRVRTGAAATEQELSQMREIYLPSPLDGPPTVRSKLQRLDRDLRSAVEVASRGRGAPDLPQAPALPQPAPAEQPGALGQLYEYGKGAISEFLGGGQGQPAAPDIGAFALDQLRALAMDDAALAAMTPAQRQQLAARLRAGGAR